ncbi:DUF2279 domain-containing protein [Haliangium sp.]|uniref:DUF2279 domain-containing protein n=1 Tax=Haliangium sp. TaxID=2663208 RepID=UPI003D0F5760
MPRLSITAAVALALCLLAGRPAYADDPPPPPADAAADTTSVPVPAGPPPAPAHAAALPTPAAAALAAPPGPEAEAAARTRRWWGIGIGAGVPVGILSVGFVNWWLSHRINFDLSRFHTRPRGWFGADTHVGGHDNVGHMFANYVVQAEVGRMFENIGYSRGRSALYATLVTSFTFNMVELLDAFTDYGWEYSDTVFNALGQAAGLVTHLYDFDRYAQLRISWLPSKLYLDGGIPRYEVVEDYGGQRFYLVANSAGIADATGVELGPARYLMPGVFYDTRGYRPALDPARYAQRERNLGVAVLIDVSALVRDRWPQAPWARRTARVLRYFQPPFLGLAYGYDLNHSRWHVPDYTLTLSGRF